MVCPAGATAATAATASSRFSLYSIGGYATVPSSPLTTSAVPEVPSTDTATTRARTSVESWSSRDQSAPLQASAQPPAGTPSPPFPPSTILGYLALVSATASPRASTATQRAPLVPKSRPRNRGPSVADADAAAATIAVARRGTAPLAARRTQRVGTREIARTSFSSRAPRRGLERGTRRGSGDASAARGPEARDDAAGAAARDARTGRASMSVGRRVRDASSSGSRPMVLRQAARGKKHEKSFLPFGEISLKVLRRRASMQYSRGGGTMSQMSVPAGAWEDLRREVRARTPASPRRPPDFLATRASSLVFPEFSSAARHGSRLARGAPPPPVPP